MENYSIKFCSKYIHEDYIYKRGKLLVMIIKSKRIVRL